MVDPSPSELDELLELMVPLQTKFAATVRVLVASLGADAGFSVDEIDDLRLAVSEVFSLMIEQAAGPSIRLRMRIDDRLLTIEARPHEGTAAVEPDDLASAILASVVDECRFEPGGVTLVKRAAEAA